jgi:D-alanyl-D-alanine carboxypeptidase/D-alanyl-D-alanine-endopeptidase (penicillin-binding protein 4)
MRPLFHALVAALALLTTACGTLERPLAPDSAAHVVPATPLAAELDAIIAAGDGEGSLGVTMLVVDAATGEVLYDRDSRRLMVPASNFKLYSSAAALDVLGPDHRFATMLLADGEYSGGALDGRIVLRAGGDPVLSSADLRQLIAQFVSGHGLRAFTGEIIVDESLFRTRPKGPGWAWDDDPDAYNTSISALMIDQNVLTVEVAPSEPGRAPAVTVTPRADYPPVVVNARTAAGARANSLNITREPFTDPILITGTIAPDAAPASARLTTRDPALWGAHLVRALLAEAGVAVAPATTVRTSATPITIATPLLTATHRSKPLSAIIADFNKPSENAIGELLLHHLAIADGSPNPSFTTGAAALTKWLETRVGLAPGSFRAADGSGLSRYNQITAAGTVTLLRYMLAHPAGQTYVDSLPIMGVDGTLRGRLRDTPAAGAVRAKTGTMSGVSSLSGYADTASGRRLVFSILTNGFVGSSAPARTLQDNLCLRLVAE